MTEADNRSTAELISQFLQAALELYDPQHYEGVISMYVVGQVIGLEDRERLEQITKFLIKTGDLAQDPGTDDVGLFRLTSKGLATARRLKER